jgi:membrane protease YdiL (CAAX protease family)
VALFFAVYFGAYVVAALLVPAVYGILRRCRGRILTSLGAYVLAHPFGRVYGRICWIPLALGLLFLLKHCGLASWKKLGVHWRRWSQFLCFFLLGAALVALMAAVRMIQFGWEWRSGFFCWKLFCPLASALSIALLEEIVFRGLLLRFLCDSFGAPIALPCSGLFFAYVHFTGHSAIAFRGPSPTISDGFRAALDSLGAIRCDFQPMAFLSLFLLGLLLGSYFLRYRNLMASIGFHSGAVFVLLASRRTVLLLAPSGPSLPKDLLSLFLCPLLLCILFSLHVHGTHKNSRREGP